MKLLSRQIAKRFQISLDSVHPMFAGLTSEQLEELGELFVDAESLDDFARDSQHYAFPGRDREGIS